MTPEDRVLLEIVRRQQADLKISLAGLERQIAEIETRANAIAPPAESVPPVLPRVQDIEAHLPAMVTVLQKGMPPVPTTAPPEPAAPPVPSFFYEPVMTEAPLPPEIPPAPPPMPAMPPPPQASLEFQFGRWLVAISAVFGVITLALFFGLAHEAIYKALGPTGVLWLSGTACVGVLAAGDTLLRKSGSLRFLGHALSAMALGCLYLTAYAACSFEPVQVIHSPVAAAVLLLSWSGYVFVVAERRRSQTLAVFAVTLAYFSTAINPAGSLTMAADFALAVTAVVFMVRNGWTVLSYFSLAGTYYGLLRRLVIDQHGILVLDTSRMIHFWPYAIYLVGAWLVFTAAVVLSRTPDFRGEQRLAFLTLNNGALAGLLALTTYISGYGHDSGGRALVGTSFLLLLTSRFAGWARIEPERLMRAYAAQGLGLFTLGLVILFTGVTRGVVLTVETLFLGLAASFSRDIVLLASAYVSAFFATVFLIFEIGVNDHHPWLLGLGGAAVMLLNAWWSRSEIRDGPHARSAIVLSSSYYCTLAVGLVFAALFFNAGISTNALPPLLALAAAVLTFLVYVIEIYELPPLAQALLVAAQGLVLFPVDNGEEQPWWTTAEVAAMTLLMTTWWTRQQVTRKGTWVVALNFIYGLALAGLTYRTIRPHVDGSDWMETAALLSMVFLVWGVWTRVWTIAAVGQLFLAASVWYFFVDYVPPFLHPYACAAAAFPIVVVYSTGRAMHEWVRLFPVRVAEWHPHFRAAGYGYKVTALLMVLRWVYVSVPPVLDQVAAFLFLGTIFMLYSLRAKSTFGVRCSFVLSGVGAITYFLNQDRMLFPPSLLHCMAFLSLLTQPVFLRLATEELVSWRESWLVVVASAVTGWYFVSVQVAAWWDPHYVTLSWAGYALLLFLIGLAGGEKRQRWGGLAVLAAAIVRVFCNDFWGMSSGYRVLTFVTLTAVTLGVGYMVLRNADKGKKEPEMPPLPPEG